MLYRLICGLCIPVVSTGTNDMYKVIDTHCTFVLFSPVFVYTEPRPSIPILSGRTESDPCLFTLLARSFEGSLEGLVSLRSPSPVLLSTGHYSLATAHYFPNLFRINTYEISVSVATKELIGSLSPLDATLMKNRGEVGLMVN